MKHSKIKYSNIDQDLVHLMIDEESQLCGIDQVYDLDHSDYVETNEKINCPDCCRIIQICKNLGKEEVEDMVVESADQKNYINDEEFISDIFVRLTDTGTCDVRVKKIAGDNRFDIKILSNSPVNDESTIMNFFYSLGDYYKFNEKIKIVLEELKRNYEIEYFGLDDNIDVLQDLMVYHIYVTKKTNVSEGALPPQHTVDPSAYARLCFVSRRRRV